MPINKTDSTTNQSLITEAGNPQRTGESNPVKSYNSVSEFPTASKLGKTVAQAGDSLYVCDGRNIVPLNYGAYPRQNLDTPDQIEVTFGTGSENLTANKITGGSISATTFTNRFNYGTEIGWNAGTVMGDGNFVGLFKTVQLDLTNLDNLLFEFGFKENHAKTRLAIIIGDAGLANSSRYQLYNATVKPEIACVVLKKSDFTTPSANSTPAFTGSGVNWANVQRIEFRFTSYGTTNADLERSVLISRLGIGGWTKPTVVLSHDDIHNSLMDELPVISSRKIPGTHCVTDIEILNKGSLVSFKMTKEEIDQWMPYGWNVCAHNIGHKLFSVPIAGYSKSGSTITMTLDWGSSTNVKENITLDVGDSITVSRANWHSINGTYTVSTVSVGASQTTITFAAGNATAIDTQTGLDGGVLTLNKNNVGVDNKLLNGMIQSMGYATDPEVLAYTYGHNSNQNRQDLFANGVKVARSTGDSGGIFPFQLRRKLGVDPATSLYLPTVNQSPSFNSVLLSVPTFLLTTLSNLQTRVTELLSTGGYLSVYWHGDEPGMTTQIRLDSLNYLANLRDAGQINIINLSELKKIVESRS